MSYHTPNAFFITSTAGAEHGFFAGRSAAEALAAHHQDAGVSVSYDEDNDVLVFDDEDDRTNAGDVDAWEIIEWQDEATALASARGWRSNDVIGVHGEEYVHHDEGRTVQFHVWDGELVAVEDNTETVIATLDDLKAAFEV